MRNELFLQKAQALLPELIRTTVRPAGHFQKKLKAGDTALLDFGNHQTGYLTLQFGYEGSHPDAPAWLRIRFAEQLQEFEEKVGEYHGWISRGWIQSEEIHLDVLPAKLEMPRRYAFRYVQIEVLDVSSKYELTLEDAFCTAVSSADDRSLKAFGCAANDLDVQLDRVACRTLHECMQTVFEDGPKRDRRLWMGDLRLQALANYETYGQNDLVKACLYLFAGTTSEEGRISACLFLEPEIEADDTVMFDYSLFFIAALRDYLRAAGDLETVRELYPTARRQWELSQAYFSENYLVKDSDVLGWCFTDWNLELNKQASAQGIYIYCVRALAELAEVLEYTADKAELAEDLRRKTAAAKAELFDPEKGVFVSGGEGQISYASQVWMVLAGVADGRVLSRIEEIPERVNMVTPYMYHHYVEALLTAGEPEKAFQVMRAYWGGMLQKGADTFWELYNPENPDESPYGGRIVNSYCHAWSCGPAYFLRKYAGKNKD